MYEKARIPKDFPSFVPSAASSNHLNGNFQDSFHIVVVMVSSNSVMRSTSVRPRGNYWRPGPETYTTTLHHQSLMKKRQPDLGFLKDLFHTKFKALKILKVSIDYQNYLNK